jgi:hypothetical protein
MPLKHCYIRDNLRPNQPTIIDLTFCINHLGWDAGFAEKLALRLKVLSEFRSCLSEIMVWWHVSR